MDVSFINPVLGSVVDVLSTVASVKPTPGTVRSKKNDEVARGDITGLMSMTGKDGRASVAITFQASAILHIANRMLPSTISTIDGLVIDLVGELTNMVLGGAKSTLEEKGHIFDMSLPVVIIGEKHLIAHKTKAPVIILPFTISAGDFYVEACYESL